jgi:peptidoglycan hydrolase-like protein with peptidoglycan-binding domain
MQAKKFLLIPFLALLLIGAVLFGTFGQTDSALAASAGHATLAHVESAYRACPPTLREGSRGFWVSQLQTALAYRKITDWTGHVLVADGYYGTRTAYVVSVFQMMHGLSGDGITGPHTWQALSAC